MLHLSHIYIYIYVLSGPWKLSGRFRCVSVIHVSVTFPLRFHYVSVNVSVDVSIAFPLGNCLPDKCCPKTPAAPPKSAMTNTALHKTAVRKTAARKTAARLLKVCTTPSLLLLAQLNCLLVCVCWYAPVKVTPKFGTTMGHPSHLGSRYTLSYCEGTRLLHGFDALQVHFPLVQKR